MGGFVAGMLLLKDDGRVEQKGRQGSSGQPLALRLPYPLACFIPLRFSQCLLLISSHLYALVTLLGKVINKAAVPIPTVLPGVPLLATSPTVDHESY